MGIRSIIIRKALSLATRTPVPTKISLSDPAVLRRRDYTVALLRNGPSNIVFVKRVVPAGVEGEALSIGSEQRSIVMIPNNDLTNYEIEYTQYRGSLELKYDSSCYYLIYRWANFDRLFLARERLAQYIYNQRTSAKADRMDALRHFFEKTKENANYSSGISSFLTETVGFRAKLSRLGA